MADSVVQEMKEMEKEITCSVCQEHYTEPKILPCLHYYCKKCVLKLDLRTASNKPFSCPECRTDTFLPKGGVEQLKTAFFINRLKSNFLALKQVHSKINVKCEGCNSRAKAEGFCRHCAVFICKDCVISHKKSETYISHEVVSLEDLKQGHAKQIVAIEPGTKMCIIHQKPLLMYCFDCDSLICYDCTVITHKEHKHEFCKVAAPEAKKDLLENLAPFKEISAKLSDAVNDIRTAKHKLETQRTSLICNIENSFEELHSIIEKRKQQLLNEASMIVEEKLHKLSAQEKKLLLANSEINNIEEYTKQHVEHGSHNEVMSMQTDIKRNIQREMKECSQLCGSFKLVEEPEIGAEVKCSEALQQLCQTNAQITQLSPNPSHNVVKKENETTQISPDPSKYIVKKEKKITQLSSDPSHYVVKGESKTTQLCPDSFQYVLKGEGKTTQLSPDHSQYVLKEEDKTELSPDPSKYLVNREDQSTQLYPDSFQYVLKGEGKTTQLSPDHSQYVVKEDDKSTHLPPDPSQYVLKEEGKTELSVDPSKYYLVKREDQSTQLYPDPSQYVVKGEGTKSAEVHQTAHVSLTTKTNGAARHNIIVVSYLLSMYDKSVMKCTVEQQIPGEFSIQYTPTVRGRHELIVSVDGQQVAGSPFSVFVSFSPSQLGKPVKVWHEVYRPRGLTINSENDIIVAEEKGDIIKLHKGGGKKVLVKHSETQLVELESIAADSEDNIYCTDFESNSVMKCDKNGENIQVFEVQQVAGPGHWGVSVAGDEVLLCERKNTGMIMIYDKELKYKRHIQHDSYDGIFRYTSVDIHGNLFVTDYHNYCIHVFSNDVFLFSFYCRSNKEKNVDAPRCASVSGQYLYVTNTTGDSVLVFTTAGEYVTSFGQHSHDKGDLNNLGCVCVDNDSFVLVTDCSNDRVLCF